jgi:flagellar hook-associated protein 2
MYSIGGYTSSTTNRVTGLSGFDTESVVKSLMDAESIPLVKAQQSRQVLLWKQEAYRDVTTQLRGFKSSYFDILNPTKNVLSSSNIKKLTATASSTDNVRVTANAGAAVGSHEVRVMQLATSAVARSGASGATAEMTLDGDTRTISLENYTADNIAANLEAAIAKQFGAGKVEVSFAGDKLTMDTTAAGGASRITLSASADDGLTGLGFDSGASNRISTSSTLASLAGKLSGELTFVDDTVSFEVNGKTFSFNATDTLKTVMDRVNADGDAGVTMRYNEVTDKLEVQAKKTGAGQTLVLQEAGGSSFFAAMGISIASGSYVENGDDAQIQINGSEIVTRSSNSFTVNDISYTLIKTHETDEADTSISVGQDVTGSMDLIKELVCKYNEVLDMINNKTTEKYDRSYLPLTDAQREAMSEDQVEQWEGKAKTGLLQNDSMLQGLAQKLRQALTDAVDGAGLTLRDIGISSTSYQERGKLTIDEDKLKTAMETNGDQVATLLNGQPEDVPSYSRT